MTAPNGDGAQSGAEGTQSGAGDPTGNGSQGTGTSGEGTQSGVVETPAVTTPLTEAERLAAELAQQRTRTQAADKRAAQIEAELKQLRDKDLPEQQKLTRDLQETQKVVETLKATNSGLALENAFLKDNTYSWHNPDAARKLIDLEGVEIGEDGKVSGMKDALKALATAHPYLVKTETGNGETPKPATSPGNNGGSGTSTPAAKALATRFPGLNTRQRR